MKFASVAVFLFSVAAAFAGPTVTIETSTQNEAPKPPKEGSKCFLDHYETTTYSPKVSGLEERATLRVYAIVKTTEGAEKTEALKTILVSEQSIAPGKEPKAAKAKVQYWGCADCAYSNAQNPKPIGWVAELEQDGKIVATASSPATEKGEVSPKIMRLVVK